jgi:carbamoyl-phosphate synthase large subunit
VTPLTVDAVRAVCQSENPDGVILQFGGYAAMDLAGDLAAAGFKVLGTAPRQVIRSQDRLQFSRLLTDMGIPHPRIGMAETPEQAMDLAEAIGYPLVVSVPADRKRNRYAVIMDAHMLEKDLMQADLSPQAPMLLEQFLEYAIEVEADALCDGNRFMYRPSWSISSWPACIRETFPWWCPPTARRRAMWRPSTPISAESPRNWTSRACSTPVLPSSTTTVYMLAVRPWACRTLPMVSKICDVPMARRAVEIMLGETWTKWTCPADCCPITASGRRCFPSIPFPRPIRC